MLRGDGMKTQFRKKLNKCFIFFVPIQQLVVSKDQSDANHPSSSTNLLKYYKIH